ncbi:MAG TPA: DGQHR domain-containing protein, partial [Campylobacterales bacterium]|nr:DGQHR domain-containing protein [Campylobacterales bacterium]
MDYTYKCFKIKQREDSDIIFLSFVANAKEIYSWSHADSIDIDKNGVQRSLQKTKWSKITKFFDTHKDNIIPNNIILAFDDEVEQVDTLSDNENMIDNQKDGFLLTNELDGYVELTINSEIKENTYIIDGQHRLKGMSEYKADLPIVVSLFINMKKLDRAFQFLTINNKA